MKRREFIPVVGGAAAVWLSRAHARNADDWLAIRGLGGR